MEDVDIDSYINGWLPYLPLYGEFTPPDKPIKTGDLSVDILVSKDYIIRNAFEKQALINLTSRGFIFRRFDVQKDGKDFYSLTERGRKLKETGSINRFYEWENSEIEREKEIRRLNDELLKSNLSNGKIQSSLLTINRWIAVSSVAAAVAALIAAIYYISELMKSQNSVKAIEILTFLVVFLFGIIGGIIIYKLMLSQTEKKE